MSVSDEIYSEMQQIHLRYEQELKNHIAELEAESQLRFDAADEQAKRASRALARVSEFERELGRYNMSAGEADQRMGESKAMREALGFDPNADDVSPNDLRDALIRRDALVAAKTIRHLRHWITDEASDLDVAIDMMDTREFRLRREAEGGKR